MKIESHGTGIQNPYHIRGSFKTLLSGTFLDISFGSFSYRQRTCFEVSYVP
jgi:hypothetical protein